MKSRWSISAALLVTFGMLVFPGCESNSLPMEEINQEEDLAEDADAVLEMSEPDAP